MAWWVGVFRVVGVACQVHDIHVVLLVDVPVRALGSEPRFVVVWVTRISQSFHKYEAAQVKNSVFLIIIGI